MSWIGSAAIGSGSERSVSEGAAAGWAGLLTDSDESGSGFGAGTSGALSGVTRSAETGRAVPAAVKRIVAGENEIAGSREAVNSIGRFVSDAESRSGEASF